MKNSKLILINSSVFVFLLLVIELILRLYGYRPNENVMQFSNVRPVDTLRVIDSHFTDSFGVFRANPNHQWDSSFEINAEGFRGRSPLDTCLLYTSPSPRDS